MPLKPGPDSAICSARECEAPAVNMVIWHNPAIHYGREKTWLACDDHTEYLRDYLAYRKFPCRVEPYVSDTKLK